MQELINKTIELCQKLNENHNININRTGDKFIFNFLNDTELIINGWTVDMLDIYLPNDENDCVTLSFFQTGENIPITYRVCDWDKVEISVK